MRTPWQLNSDTQLITQNKSLHGKAPFSSEFNVKAVLLLAVWLMSGSYRVKKNITNCISKMYYHALRCRRETINHKKHNGRAFWTVELDFVHCWIFYFFASYPFPCMMFPKVMFADIIQQKIQKRTVTDHPRPKLHVFQASRCFHIHRVIVTKQTKLPTSKMRRERVERVGVHGSWCMMHERTCTSSTR